MRRVIPTIGLLLLCTAGGAQENTSYSTASESRSWVSRAGLMVEPSVNLVSLSSNIRTSDMPIISQDTSAKVDGYGFGARLTGHVFESMFVGADVRYARIDMSDSSLGQVSGDSYNLAPTIGVQMPVVGLRLWYSRIISGEYNPGPGRAGVDLRFADATGNRLGVGFHILAVSLNLEYEELKFGRTDIQAVGPMAFNSSNAIDYDQRGVVASLSFPIAL